METKALLNNPSRTPILADMLKQLSGQTVNPILSSSPAIKEMQDKAKTKNKDGL